MAGGIAVPGDATAADVIAPATFSSGAGVGIAGTSLSPKGMIRQTAMAVVAPGTSLTLTFESDIADADTVVVAVSARATTVSALSGLGATWSKVVSNNAAGGYDTELWQGVGANGTTNTVTVTLAASANAEAYAADVPGTLTLSNSAFGSSSATVSIPANGFVVGACTTNSTGGGYGGCFSSSQYVPLSQSIRQSSCMAVGTNSPSSASATLTFLNQAGGAVNSSVAASFTVS